MNEYTKVTKRGLKCEAGVGVTHERGNPQIVRCSNPAAWCQKVFPHAYLCETCRERIDKTSVAKTDVD